MKTSCALILGLLTCNITLAKAPVVENHALNQTQRLPAQTQFVGLRSLEHYMDLSCHELVDQSDVDGFSKYLKVEFKKLDADFCSLVGNIGGEESFSQADQMRVGLGTFSKLVEGHYFEYQQKAELDHFQDKSCDEYMESVDEGSFSSFFKAQLLELGNDICSKIGNYSKEDSSGRIGLGTYSKLIETSFWEYNSKKRELR